ncbi:MAG: poly-gamma-glutamate hydrolase family protein, partial [Ilumatobacteraceae bacterium]|nr:poly-gamma-glutamate hydrolase family protein [Ilumatobacteraceae bacterium]
MNLSELLQYDDVTEESILRSTFGFMAFHGGALEEMTDTIASRAAERAGASYYGIQLPDKLEWHLPSHTVTADQSPALASFLSHVNIVVTVHGFGRAGFFTSLLLGGRNRRLASHLGATLRTHLPAYTIIDDIDEIPSNLRGMHQDNPVNVVEHAGVQLELPPRVRGASPLWWDWEGP